MGRLNVPPNVTVDDDDNERHIFNTLRKFYSQGMEYTSYTEDGKFYIRERPDRSIEVNMRGANLRYLDKPIVVFEVSAGDQRIYSEEAGCWLEFDAAGRGVGFLINDVAQGFSPANVSGKAKALRYILKIESFRDIKAERVLAYKGEPGLGKDTVAAAVAHLMNEELWYLTGHEDATERDLLYRRVLTKEGTKYQGSSFIYVKRNGGICVLSEAQYMDEEGIGAIKDAIASGKHPAYIEKLVSSCIEKSRENLQKILKSMPDHPRARTIITTNIKRYGTKMRGFNDEAILDRIVSELFVWKRPKPDEAELQYALALEKLHKLRPELSGKELEDEEERIYGIAEGLVDTVWPLRLTFLGYGKDDHKAFMQDDFAKWKEYLEDDTELPNALDSDGKPIRRSVGQGVKRAPSPRVLRDILEFAIKFPKTFELAPWSVIETFYNFELNNMDERTRREEKEKSRDTFAKFHYRYKGERIYFKDKDKLPPLKLTKDSFSWEGEYLIVRPEPVSIENGAPKEYWDELKIWVPKSARNRLPYEIEFWLSTGNSKNQQLLYSLLQLRGVLRKHRTLVGPGGTGKSVLNRGVVKLLSGPDVESYSLSRATRLQKLIQETELDEEGNTYYLDGPVLRAARENKTVHIGELTQGRPGVQAGLNEVLEQGLIVLADGTIVRACEAFGFLFDANTPGGPFKVSAPSDEFIERAPGTRVDPLPASELYNFLVNMRNYQGRQVNPKIIGEKVIDPATDKPIKITIDGKEEDKYRGLVGIYQYLRWKIAENSDKPLLRRLPGFRLMEYLVTDIADYWNGPLFSEDFADKQFYQKQFRRRFIDSFEQASKDTGSLGEIKLLLKEAFKECGLWDDAEDGILKYLDGEEMVVTKIPLFRSAKSGDRETDHILNYLQEVNRGSSVETFIERLRKITEELYADKTKWAGFVFEERLNRLYKLREIWQVLNLITSERGKGTGYLQSLEDNYEAMMQIMEGVQARIIGEEDWAVAFLKYKSAKEDAQGYKEAWDELENMWGKFDTVGDLEIDDLLGKVAITSSIPLFSKEGLGEILDVAQGFSPAEKKAIEEYVVKQTAKLTAKIETIAAEIKGEHLHKIVPQLALLTKTAENVNTILHASPPFTKGGQGGIFGEEKLLNAPQTHLLLPLHHLLTKALPFSLAEQKESLQDMSAVEVKEYMEKIKADISTKVDRAKLQPLLDFALTDANRFYRYLIAKAIYSFPNDTEVLNNCIAAAENIHHIWQEMIKSQMGGEGRDEREEIERELAKVREEIIKVEGEIEGVRQDSNEEIPKRLKEILESLDYSVTEGDIIKLVEFKLEITESGFKRYFKKEQQGNVTTIIHKFSVGRNKSTIEILEKILQEEEIWSQDWPVMYQAKMKVEEKLKELKASSPPTAQELQSLIARLTKLKEQEVLLLARYEELERGEVADVKDIEESLAELGKALDEKLQTSEGMDFASAQWETMVGDIDNRRKLGEDLYGIAADTDGTIYTATGDDKIVAIRRPDGRIEKLRVNVDTYDCTVTEKHLFVATSNGVYVYNKSTLELDKTIGPRGSKGIIAEGLKCTGVAVRKGGNEYEIFVSNEDGSLGKILKYTKSLLNNYSRPVHFDISYPRRLNFDADGKLLVTHSAGIMILGPDTLKPLYGFAKGHLEAIDQAIEQDGHIFTVRRNTNKISVFKKSEEEIEVKYGGVKYKVRKLVKVENGRLSHGNAYRFTGITTHNKDLIVADRGAQASLKMTWNLWRVSFPNQLSAEADRAKWEKIGEYRQKLGGGYVGGISVDEKEETIYISTEHQGVVHILHPDGKIEEAMRTEKYQDDCDVTERHLFVAAIDGVYVYDKNTKQLDTSIGEDGIIAKGAKCEGVAVRKIGAGYEVFVKIRLVLENKYVIHKYSFSDNYLNPGRKKITKDWISRLNFNPAGALLTRYDENICIIDPDTMKITYDSGKISEFSTNRAYGVVEYDGYIYVVANGSKIFVFRRVEDSDISKRVKKLVKVREIPNVGASDSIGVMNGDLIAVGKRPNGFAHIWRRNVSSLKGRFAPQEQKLLTELRSLITELKSIISQPISLRAAEIIRKEILPKLNEALAEKPEERERMIEELKESLEKVRSMRVIPVSSVIPAKAGIQELAQLQALIAKEPELLARKKELTKTENRTPNTELPWIKENRSPTKDELDKYLPMSFRKNPDGSGAWIGKPRDKKGRLARGYKWFEGMTDGSKKMHRGFDNDFLIIQNDTLKRIKENGNIENVQVFDKRDPASRTKPAFELPFAIAVDRKKELIFLTDVRGNQIWVLKFENNKYVCINSLNISKPLGIWVDEEKSIMFLVWEEGSDIKYQQCKYYEGGFLNLPMDDSFVAGELSGRMLRIHRKAGVMFKVQEVAHSVEIYSYNGKDELVYNGYFDVDNPSDVLVMEELDLIYVITADGLKEFWYDKDEPVINKQYKETGREWGREGSGDEEFSAPTFGHISRESEGELSFYIADNGNYRIQVLDMKLPFADDALLSPEEKQKVLASLKGTQGLKNNESWQVFNASIALTNFWRELNFAEKQEILTLLKGTEGLKSNESWRVFYSSVALANLWAELSDTEKQEVLISLKGMEGLKNNNSWQAFHALMTLANLWAELSDVDKQEVLTSLKGTEGLKSDDSQRAFWVSISLANLWAEISDADKQEVLTLLKGSEGLKSSGSMQVFVVFMDPANLWAEISLADKQEVLILLKGSEGLKSDDNRRVFYSSIALANLWTELSDADKQEVLISLKGTGGLKSFHSHVVFKASIALANLLGAGSGITSDVKELENIETKLAEITRAKKRIAELRKELEALRIEAERAQLQALVDREQELLVRKAELLTRDEGGGTKDAKDLPWIKENRAPTKDELDKYLPISFRKKPDGTGAWIGRRDNNGKPISGSGAGEFNSPTGAAEGFDNDILIVDGGNKRLQRIKSDGTKEVLDLRFGNNHRAFFRSPFAITVDRKKELIFVSDELNQRVLVLKFKNGKYVASRFYMGRPLGIWADEENSRLFVCSNKEKTIKYGSYDKYGKLIGSMKSFGGMVDLGYIFDIKYHRKAQKLLLVSRKRGDIGIYEFSYDGKGKPVYETFTSFGDASGIMIMEELNLFYVTADRGLVEYWYDENEQDIAKRYIKTGREWGGKKSGNNEFYFSKSGVAVKDENGNFTLYIPDFGNQRIQVLDMKLKLGDDKARKQELDRIDAELAEIARAKSLLAGLEELPYLHLVGVRWYAKLESEEVGERKKAVEALGIIGDWESVEKLLEALVGERDQYNPEIMEAIISSIIKILEREGVDKKRLRDLVDKVVSEELRKDYNHKVYYKDRDDFNKYLNLVAVLKMGIMGDAVSLKKMVEILTKPDLMVSIEKQVRKSISRLIRYGDISQAEVETVLSKDELRRDLGGDADNDNIFLLGEIGGVEDAQEIFEVILDQTDAYHPNSRGSLSLKHVREASRAIMRMIDTGRLTAAEMQQIFPVDKLYRHLSYGDKNYSSLHQMSAVILGRIGDGASAQKLAERLVVEDDEAVLDAIVDALERMIADGRMSEDGIKRWLPDKKESIKFDIESDEIINMRKVTFPLIFTGDKDSAISLINIIILSLNESVTSLKFESVVLISKIIYRLIVNGRADVEKVKEYILDSANSGIGIEKLYEMLEKKGIYSYYDRYAAAFLLGIVRDAETEKNLKAALETEENPLVLEQIYNSLLLITRDEGRGTKDEKLAGRILEWMELVKKVEVSLTPEQEGWVKDLIEGTRDVIKRESKQNNKQYIGIIFTAEEDNMYGVKFLPETHGFLYHRGSNNPLHHQKPYISFIKLVEAGLLTKGAVFPGENYDLSKQRLLEEIAGKWVEDFIKGKIKDIERFEALKNEDYTGGILRYKSRGDSWTKQYITSKSQVSSEYIVVGEERDSLRPFDSGPDIEFIIYTDGTVHNDKVKKMLVERIAKVGGESEERDRLAKEIVEELKALVSPEEKRRIEMGIFKDLSLSELQRGDVLVHLNDLWDLPGIEIFDERVGDKYRVRPLYTRPGNIVKPMWDLTAEGIGWYRVLRIGKIDQLLARDEGRRTRDAQRIKARLKEIEELLKNSLPGENSQPILTHLESIGKRNAGGEYRASNQQGGFKNPQGSALGPNGEVVVADAGKLRFDAIMPGNFTKEIKVRDRLGLELAVWVGLFIDKDRELDKDRTLVFAIDEARQDIHIMEYINETAYHFIKRIDKWKDRGFGVGDITAVSFDPAKGYIIIGGTKGIEYGIYKDEELYYAGRIKEFDNAKDIKPHKGNLLVASEGEGGYLWVLRWDSFKGKYIPQEGFNKLKLELVVFSPQSIETKGNFVYIALASYNIMILELVYDEENKSYGRNLNYRIFSYVEEEIEELRVPVSLTISDKNILHLTYPEGHRVLRWQWSLSENDALLKEKAELEQRLEFLERDINTRDERRGTRDAIIPAEFLDALWGLLTIRDTEYLEEAFEVLERFVKMQSFGLDSEFIKEIQRFNPKAYQKIESMRLLARRAEAVAVEKPDKEPLMAI